jgi:predicted DNA-binding transcriptional regulator AlpA
MKKPPLARPARANAKGFSELSCPEVQSIIDKAKATIQEQMLRLPQVKLKIGLAGSTIWKGVKEGTLPPPVALGARAVAWRESELQAWIEVKVLAARIGRDFDMHEFITLLTNPQSPTANLVQAVHYD